MKTEKQKGEIIEKYLIGKSSRDDLKKSIALFTDPAMNGYVASYLKGVWGSDKFQIPKECESSRLHLLLDNIHEKIESELLECRRWRVKRYVINISKIAAVLLVGISFGFLLFTFKPSEQVTYTSMAPKGSISQVILPDHTYVYLNSDSRISYTHSGLKKHREVLLEGEAWFHVSEDIKKEFIVRTVAYDIKVTGTKFNVKAYKDEKKITTTLESGSVVIPSTSEFNITTDRILKPGEQLTYNRITRTFTINKVKTVYYTSWKDNKLVFINMSLEELVVLLERKYGVDIVIDDATILKYHYDGTLKNETILEVLELIKVTMPIQYEIKGQKIHITKK